MAYYDMSFNDMTTSALCFTSKRKEGETMSRAVITATIPNELVEKLDARAESE